MCVCVRMYSFVCVFACMYVWLAIDKTSLLCKCVCVCVLDSKKKIFIPQKYNKIPFRLTTTTYLKFCKQLKNSVILTIYK